MRHFRRVAHQSQPPRDLPAIAKSPRNIAAAPWRFRPTQPSPARKRSRYSMRAYLLSAILYASHQVRPLVGRRAQCTPRSRRRAIEVGNVPLRTSVARHVPMSRSRSLLETKWWPLMLTGLVSRPVARDLIVPLQSRRCFARPMSMLRCLMLCAAAMQNRLFIPWTNIPFMLNATSHDCRKAARRLISRKRSGLRRARTRRKVADQHAYHGAPPSGR